MQKPEKSDEITFAAQMALAVERVEASKGTRHLRKWTDELLDLSRDYVVSVLGPIYGEDDAA